jgi:MFS family permease
MKSNRKLPGSFQNSPLDVSCNNTTDSVSDSDQSQKVPPGNWAAWSMQLALGMIAGGVFGMMIARHLFRMHFISIDQLLIVAAGAALCCGAFASFYGDRTWMPPSLYLPKDPPPPLKARTYSKNIGLLGAALAILPVFLHLLFGGSPHNESSSSGPHFFLLIIAVVPGFLLYYALRTGTFFWSGRMMDQDEAPLFYWIYVVINALIVLCIFLKIIF